MDICRFIESVNNTDWQRFDGAKYFQNRYDGVNSFAKIVPQALIDLALVDKESNELLDMGFLERTGKSRADFIANAPICSNLMFAIGNDHAGEYYHVARGALPFILEVAVYGNHLISRTCAINILIDLYCFGPEGGSDDLEVFVKTSIENAINMHRENFSIFFASDMRNKELMKDLFAIVDEKD